MAQPLSSQTQETVTLRAGVVDLRARQLRLFAGGMVALTTREESLLRRLTLNPGEVVTAEQLLRDVWQRPWSGEPSELGVVRNAIFKLRQKVEQNLDVPEHVLTVHGDGYRFMPLVGDPFVPPPPLLVAVGGRYDMSSALPMPGEAWSPRWDVGHEVEERRITEVLSAPYTPLMLVGPWRSGKSWLLRRVLARLGPGDVSVRLDPRGVPPEALHDFASLAAWIALLVSEAVGLPEDEGESALSGTRPISWRLKRWMETRVLPAVDARLLLVIEDLDRLATGRSFSELAAMLRIWAEEQRPGWSRLRLVASSAVSPARLSANIPSSPLNLGVTVPLGGLSAAAIQSLARRAGLADIDVDALQAELGGSPYLLRLALAALVAARRDTAGALGPDALDAALQPALHELGQRLELRPELLVGLRGALSAPDEPLPDPVLDTLLRLGLLVSQRRPYRAAAPRLAALLAG